jgi:predicted transcriptional regulator
MGKKEDFLDEMVAERTGQRPEFRQLLEAAVARRELLRTLAQEREARHLTQTAVAAAMGTSQSSVARLERTASDAKISTVERFAAALGLKVEFHVVSAGEVSGAPAVTASTGAADESVLYE